MPIQGFSSAGRWDRIGKIRIGMRVENPQRPGTTIPRAVDYFVCPPEVQEVYGEKPKLLYPIMFPSDNPDEWMSHFYRCYGTSYSLMCMGDGVTASQKTDMETGAMVDRNTPEGRWEWREGLTCEGPECPQFKSRACRPIMRLQFFLPEVPGGIGVYEVSTTSYYSRANFDRTINAVRNMALKLTGEPRIGLVPLGLALGPQEVNPPGQKKKTVQIMHLTTGKLKLGDFLRALQIAPAKVFALPQPIAQTPQEAELEEPPGDLLGPYGDEPDEKQPETPECPASGTSAPTTEDPPKEKKGPGRPAKPKPETQAEMNARTARENAQVATTAPQTAGAGSPPPDPQPAKIDVVAMSKQVLGENSVRDFLMPEMVRLYGQMMRLSDLTAEQTQALARAIDSERERRVARLGSPPSAEEEAATADLVAKAAAKAAGTQAQPPADPTAAPEYVKEHTALRKQLNRTLMERFNKNQDACIEWLDQKFHTRTSETLGLAELRKAVELSKEAAPTEESGPALF
jgi:hypothetical protein